MRVLQQQVAPTLSRAKWRGSKMDKREREMGRKSSSITIAQEMVKK
jgi:hypothetical protein